MSEFTKKYDKIIEEIENNIQNEKELNFDKEKINEISTMFMSMFDNMTKYSESKINQINISLIAIIRLKKKKSKWINR